MRARLLAVLILCILIGLPAFLYWYLFHRQTASFIFAAPAEEKFSVHLHGTLNYKWFPMLDSFLQFQQNCNTKCTVGPIPPAIYTVSIVREGLAPLEQEVNLGLGEQKMIQLEPRVEIKLLPQAVSEGVDISSGIALFENAQANISASLQLLHIFPGGKVYAYRVVSGVTEIGIVSSQTFIPMFTLQYAVTSGKIDTTGRYFIFSVSEKRTIVISTSFVQSIDIPLGGTIVSVDRFGAWKIRTNDGVWEESEGAWKKREDFTDFIDVSPRYRLGYIASPSSGVYSSLGGIQKPILILFDRESNKMTLIDVKSPIDAMAWIDGIPTIFFSDGTRSTIDISSLY